MVADSLVCFISHAWTGGQHDLARHFALRLNRFKGLRAWIDENENRPGQDLLGRLQAGLREESDCCIALLSPEYLSSKTAPKELAEAHTLYYERGKPLIPIIIKRLELPLEVVRLVYLDFSNAISSETLEVNKKRFKPHMKRLVNAVRGYFSVATNDLAFMTPPDRGEIVLATNRRYSGPYPDKKKSTTVVFYNKVTSILNLLAKRCAMDGWESCETDYVDEEDIRNLVQGPKNIISYASSKINKCTELILRVLYKDYGVDVAFLLETDLRRGRRDSQLPKLDEAERAALIWKGRSLYHDDQSDHGLIVRASPKNSMKTWWVFAGCGRPGSVAARKLVFEREWDARFWKAVADRWKRSSFIACFTVQHDRKRTSELGELERLEIEWL